MDYIEYKDAKLQFVGIRKHFFRDKQYYVTVFQEYFTIGSSKDTQSPKYKIQLKLSTKINWNLKKLKDGVILQSFVFPYQNKFKTLCADPLDLLRYNEILNLKVTYEGIGDTYIPLLQIGKGSSAKVYSAQNVINSKVYAIKAIEKSFLNQTDKGSGLEAYNMEVSILKIISGYSSNFLILREIYEGDHTYYLVTEYLEGQSLSEEIDRAKGLHDKRLPIQNIKVIIAKLLQSVALLHSHKIIHRDLKPDNMMFAKRNDYFTLVLVDFGLATIETLDKYLFPKCGTPGYVAPEVLTTSVSSKYTTKVDVFSCGCILYKLLTGRSIFNGNSFDEVLRANKKCEIDLKLPMDQHYITEDSIVINQSYFNENLQMVVTITLYQINCQGKIQSLEQVLERLFNILFLIKQVSIALHSKHHFYPQSNKTISISKFNVKRQCHSIIWMKRQQILKFWIKNCIRFNCQSQRNVIKCVSCNHHKMQCFSFFRKNHFQQQGVTDWLIWQVQGVTFLKESQNEFNSHQIFQILQNNLNALQNLQLFCKLNLKNQLQKCYT